MKKEYVLWGIPRGETDRLHERVLHTQAKNTADLERVKAQATRDGWHSFRVQILDLEAMPDFIGTVKKSI